MRSSPAETFVIGYDGGGNPLLSPEISVKLDIAELAGVESEGAYVGTNVNNFGHLISNVFATEDGTNHYLQLANGMLRLCTIDGDDPTRVEMKDLLQIETGSNDNTVIAATGTVGSEGFAIVYPTDYDSPSTCLWFDADSGRVTAGDEFSGHEPPRSSRAGASSSPASPCRRQAGASSAPSSRKTTEGENHLRVRKGVQPAKRRRDQARLR